MAKQKPHLAMGRVTGNEDEDVALVLAMWRELTGDTSEPTEEELAEIRAELRLGEGG